MKFVYRVLFEAIIVYRVYYWRKADNAAWSRWTKVRRHTQRRGHERWDGCRRPSKRHLLFFIVHGRTIKCKVSGKKKNIQKMLRGGLEVPEFDIKGETVLQPLYGASKTNWSVSTKHGSVSSWLPEKKILFRTNKCLERITKFCHCVPSFFCDNNLFKPQGD